jgi:hypothetical protein
VKFEEGLVWRNHSSILIWREKKVEIVNRKCRPSHLSVLRRFLSVTMWRIINIALTNTVVFSKPEKPIVSNNCIL